MSNFYNRLIKPLSKDSDQAEREIVLNYLLVGLIGLALLSLVNALLQLVIFREKYMLARVSLVAVVAGFLAFLYVISRYKGQHARIAVLLTVGLGIIPCLMLYQWGLLVPFGIAIISLTIVMGGILVSARFSLYIAGLIAIFLSVLQYAQAHGHWQPDLNWMKTASNVSDVIGFSAIFFIIALVSWLFNRQMELSLKRARRSEAALKRQKVLLEIKVEKRAKQLEAAQLEKMQELYRFAELGRLSTALFHDLANHLSTVSLDIEGLSAKDKSGIFTRISQNVGHIDEVVKRVRQQLGGEKHVEVFNVLDEIDEVIKILSSTATGAGVEIIKQVDKSVRQGLSYKGDTIRFRQIILNLISNGLEAYSDKKSSRPRTVEIALERRKTNLIIHVTDHGSGVRPADQDKIFKPFYTTKQRGVGIGLFIVKQVVETDFKGSLTLDNSDKRSGTTFTVSLPGSYYA